MEAGGRCGGNSDKGTFLEDGCIRPDGRRSRLSGMSPAKFLSPGENDLATMHPRGRQAQWHPEKNGNLTPQQFLPGSSRSVWWKCRKGHTSGVPGLSPGSAGRDVRYAPAAGSSKRRTIWRLSILSWRNSGTRNEPEHVSPGTRKKVWWTCEKGHEWQASVVSRTSLGTGCPVCSGKKVVPGENDLATAYPEIAAQWHPEKNGRQTPQEVSPFSNRKVWWKCALGHAYQAVVASRTMGGGDCPYCWEGREFFPDSTIWPRQNRYWQNSGTRRKTVLLHREMSPPEAERKSVDLSGASRMEERDLFQNGLQAYRLSGMRGKIPEKTEVYRRNLTEVSIRVTRKGGADRLKVLHGEG